MSGAPPYRAYMNPHMESAAEWKATAGHYPIDRDGLRRQTDELREGFLKSGTLYFFLTLLGTIGSGWLSDMVASKVAGKFAPLEKIPFLSKLPPKVLNNVKRLKKLAGKSLPLSDIVYSAIFPIMAFFTIWLTNFLILQLVILRDCKRVNKATLKIARDKALAGAVPCGVVSIVAMVVLWILARIPILTIPIAVAYAMNGIVVALILVLLGTNFTFGGALGVTLARKEGCSEATAPPPPPAPAPAPGPAQ